MLKKLIVVLFLIMLSILLLCCNITERICIEKKVVIVGNIISIKSISPLENKEEKNNRTINTSIQNIGIITCIDKETNQFVAFGHDLSLNSNNVDFIDYKCYKANLIDIEKSCNNRIGKLNVMSDIDFEIGNMIENNKTGVVGHISDISIFDKENLEEFYIGSRFNIKTGDAKIYVNLDGKGLKEYKILIDSVDYLDKKRNIHIKVIDNELINKTGGIVKGMSGSPIIQNGKLIGAVNCVTKGNPTDAYGIFADSLLK